MPSGMRLDVSPAMVKQHLHEGFGVPEGAVIVHRHAHEDFIVRFSRVRISSWSSAPCRRWKPFALVGRRWRRTSRASTGSFRYTVLVALAGIPAHARCADMAQLVLGSSRAKVEVAPDSIVVSSMWTTNVSSHQSPLINKIAKL